MSYSIRDLLGHFVKPRSARGKMCPHACCRNKRVHPANFPVILPTQLLRRASDDELANHYGRHGDNDRVRAQVLREMERRDQAEARRKASSQRAAARKFERQEQVETAILAAEHSTRGNMLNAKGRRAGISERTLFTGSEAHAMRYASEELLRHWETNPRPTARNMSSNPAVVRKARSQSNMGRSGRHGGSRYAGTPY